MSSNTYNKLSDDVINQIKDFKHTYNSYYGLSEEQNSLIDELIPNEELRERYKNYGLCKECSQPDTGNLWCQSCNSKHFQQDFNKWTSGNKEIDEFIQNFQSNATRHEEVLEWIPYEKLVILNTLQKVVLAPCIKQNGLMDIFIIGIPVKIHGVGVVILILF